MMINDQLIREIVEKRIISERQGEEIYKFLLEKGENAANFRFSHLLYYFGGFLAISAMSVFMTLGWGLFLGWGMFTISLVYAALGIIMCEYFLKQKNLLIPAGIAATFAIVMTPLIVFSLQYEFGLWPEGWNYRDYHQRIDFRWLSLEISTLLAASLALLRYRLPYLVMPVSVTLLYMSMDITPIIFDNPDPNWVLRKTVSIVFGALMLLFAFFVDYKTARSGKDYPFWIYLFGLISFWGALTLSDTDSEWTKFAYFCINLLLILISTLIARRVFAVFGGIGSVIYLSHLAHNLFVDSILFPFILSFIGFCVISLGILWQKYGPKNQPTIFVMWRERNKNQNQTLET